MAVNYTFDDITRGYNAVANLRTDSKNNILGQPTIDELYYTRLVLFLIIQLRARGGDTGSQGLISSIPLAALKNDTASVISVVYNSETFTWGASDVCVMRQNEADFFIEKSTFAGTPLTRVPLSEFYTAGKPCFFYW